MTADSAIEVLQLTRARKRQSVTDAAEQLESLAELSPMQVFERRLALEEFATEAEQQRVGRLKQHFTRIESEVAHEETNEGDQSA